jgi:hypothetical protein
MKKFLLTVLIVLCTLSANAVPQYLTSIIREKDGKTEKTDLVYNDREDWTLVAVNDEFGELSFDRSQLSSNLLKMTRTNNDGHTIIYDMILNEDGNVVRVDEYDNGILAENYVLFEYNNSKLVSYKQISPDGVTETTITYEGYAVSKVETIKIGDESSREITTFEYENAISYTTLQSLWDIFFNVDLNDMQWLSLSGYLGYWPGGVPSKITTVGCGETVIKDLDWKCCVYGFPDAITITSNDNIEVYYFSIDIDGAISVESVEYGDSEPRRFYDVNGVEVSGDAKGLVIERKEDGSTVKRLNR